MFNIKKSFNDGFNLVESGTIPDSRIQNKLHQNLGGGGGGGAQQIVQYTPQDVAQQAGQMQSQSAYAAGQLASQSIRDAMNSINQQYNNAQTQLNPYNQTGIQALDQLNQYMGLNPYNPAGTQPTAPTAPTAQNTIKQSDINAYELAHSSMAGSPGGGQDSDWGYLRYSGVGAHPFTNLDPNQITGVSDAQKQWILANGGANTVGAYGTNIGPNGPLTYNNGLNNLEADPTVNSAVQNYLFDQNKDQYNKAYQTDLSTYNMQNAAYNNANDLYNQYTAQGPLSSSQIQDKISNLPGYQAQLGQGVNAIQNTASAQGYLGSGRILKELNTFGQNTLSQFYGNELSRLAGLVGTGQQAAGSSASASANQSNALSSLYSSLGDTQANATLASGNAQSQAAIAGNQAYKTFSSGGGGGGSGIGAALGGIGSLVSSFL